MDKLKMQAKPMDIVLKKVMEICPAAVQDGKVDFDRLRAELSDVVDDSISESYDFTWVGKRKSIIEANKPINKTLRPCKEESKNWGTTKNLYIEGDNLEVLKLLQESYLNKVKMIYIDPPYNTGKDFIYKDNFKQSKEDEAQGLGLFDEEGNKMFRNTETNGRFHSDWCSMIYPRLKLARDFLSDDGVIFISIDDNEVANLRKICDEVFGEGNFVGDIVWLKGNAQNDAQNIQKNHEYVLSYRRSEKTTLSLDKDTKRKIYKDQHGYYYEGAGLTTGGAGGTLNNRPNLGYSIYYNKETKDIVGIADYDKEKARISNDEKEIYVENKDLINKGYTPIRPPKKAAGLGSWTWQLDKLNKEKDTILIKETAKGFTVIKKEYVDESLIEKNGDTLIANIFLNVSIKSFIDDVASSFGTSELTTLFNNKFFEYSKPRTLIEKLLRVATKNNDIILDFFSGSSTTAHAVMQLNSEDGGNRKFIMVQLPEDTDEDSKSFKAGYKNICEIGKERIRRAGEKIKTENPNKDIDIGFRILKLDSSNMEDVYYNPSKLNQRDLLNLIDNIKNDRKPLDLLFGVMINWGVSLSKLLSEHKVGNNTIYVVGDNDLVACFDTNITIDTITKMATFNPTRVVFRDSCFERDDAKINMMEIFKSICDWDEKQAKDNIKVI